MVSYLKTHFFLRNVALITDENWAIVFYDLKCLWQTYASKHEYSFIFLYITTMLNNAFLLVYISRISPVL